MKKLFTLFILLSICFILAGCDLLPADITEKLDYILGKELTDEPDQQPTPHTHSYTSVVTDPTTSSKGYTTYTCECGHSYISDYTDVIIIYSEGLEFALNSQATGYIVTGIGSCKDADVVIPPTYNNLPVTGIGDEAFCECEGLVSVIIPNSVTSIGFSAFAACESLESVAIGSSVAGIEEQQAFIFCPNLSNISVDESNPNYQSIDGSVYSKDGSVLVQYALGKKNNTFIIPDNVTSISDAAFAVASGLVNVIIPDSVTSIGFAAFCECDSLESVTIGSGVTSISEFAFKGCDVLTSVTINESVTSIGASAFSECDMLASIIIPNSVTSIGDRAFRHCKKLLDVTMGSGTTTIGEDAFAYCYSLTNIYITDLAAWCNIDFYNDLANPLSYAKKFYLDGELVTDLVIPDGVTNIKKHAFFNCDTIVEITIPNSVTSIGSYAFAGCDGITAIIIPDSVTSIVTSAFGGCISLKTVVFENPNGWYIGDEPISQADITDSTDRAVILLVHSFNPVEGESLLHRE